VASVTDRLEVPLQHRTLWATGDVLLWAELDLLIKDNAGHWKAATWLVDSGTEMTSMPAWLAKQLDLPMPRNAISGAAHKQTGLEFRSGLLRVQVVGLDSTEFVFPCFFLGDPNTPSSRSRVTVAPRKLLALSGVVDKVRILFDGTPSPQAPYGNLILETA
jgi:hypothetical protein